MLICFSQLDLYSKVMLLANGSFIVPNDDDHLVSGNTDPFILQLVEEPSASTPKEFPKSVPKMVNKPAGIVCYFRISCFSSASVDFE